MEKSQPVLPLRAMSGFLAMQHQGLEAMSLAHIIMRDIPGLACHQGIIGGCPGAGQNWSGLSLVATLRRVGSVPRLGSTVDLTVVVMALVNQPEGMSMGELVSPFVCPKVAFG